MKITRKLALRVSQNMCENLKESYMKDSDAIRDILYDYILSHTPDSVNNFSEKEYIKHTSFCSLSLVDSTGKTLCINVKFKEPVPNKDYGSIYICDSTPGITNEIKNELRALLASYTTKKQQYVTVTYKIQNSLYELKNTTAVKKDFPEAMKYIDEISKNPTKDVTMVSESIKQVKEILAL